MGSPAVLEFDTLLAPIPGANPAGEPMPFLVRKELDDARKEINPKSFAPDDPRRPEQQGSGACGPADGSPGEAPRFWRAPRRFAVNATNGTRVLGPHLPYYRRR